MSTETHESDIIRIGDWNSARRHADEALQLGRQAAHHAILCGIELLRLRADYPETRGGEQNGHDGRFAPWASAVESELGIPERTASRWMSAARRQLPQLATALAGGDEGAIVDAEVVVLSGDGAEAGALEAAVEEVTRGKTLEQLLLPLDGGGRLDPEALSPKKRDRYELLKAAAEGGDQRATELLERVEAGELDPGRAWAGWKGETKRSSLGADGDGPTAEAMKEEKERIFEDRMRQIRKGCMLPGAWKKLTPSQRLKIIEIASREIITWPAEIREELALALLDNGPSKRRGR